MRRLPWMLVMLAASAGCGFGDNQGGGAGLAGDGSQLGPPDAAVTVGTDAHAPDGAPGVDASLAPDAPPDPPAVTCELAPQADCPVGDACDLAGASGATTCRDVLGSGTSNDRCTASTDCAAGWTCAGGANAPAVRWCMRLCSATSTCGTNERCVHALTDSQGAPNGANVCSNGCNLFTQGGCPAGLGCLAVDSSAGDYTDCAVQGVVSDGGSCASSLDCRNGSACIVEGGTQTCHPYCNLASSACASGLSCVGLNPALHVTGTDVGVCI